MPYLVANRKTSIRCRIEYKSYINNGEENLFTKVNFSIVLLFNMCNFFKLIFEIV